MGDRGDHRLSDLSSCSAKFLPSRAGFFRFFLIARLIDFDRVLIPLGASQSLPWVGSVVDRTGRVGLSALAKPRSKCRVTLARITSRDPSKDHGYMRAKSRSTMHEVWNQRSIAERWSTRSRATSLMPESQGLLPPPPVEARRSKQDRVKLVHQQRRGASTLH